MGFPVRKQYGQSKTATCPFCGAQAFNKNAQDVPVCKAHVNESMPDVKCLCGEWLDLKIGKWGPFYTCFNCGIVNLNKALEYAEQQSRARKKNAPPKTKEAETARKFEAMAEKMKSVEGIPTLDELSKNW